MLENAKLYGWSVEKVFELTMKIDAEREEAGYRLRLLSGPGTLLNDDNTSGRV